MKRYWAVCGVLVVFIGLTIGGHNLQGASPKLNSPFDQVIGKNASQMIEEGRRTFRFDTFGDEAFWGDTLANKAIAELNRGWGRSEPGDALTSA